jgi:hypothetical protein
MIQRTRVGVLMVRYNSEFMYKSNESVTGSTGSATGWRV